MATQIIYYSLTGNTKRVCSAIAGTLGCSTDAIIAPFAGKPGILKMIKLGFYALTGRKTGITAPPVQAQRDDLMILGAQVWAGCLSAPMQDFLNAGPPLPERIALVLTSGDPKYPTQVIDSFAQMTGRAPIATLHISETDVKAGAFDCKLAEFCARLHQQGAA